MLKHSTTLKHVTYSERCCTEMTLLTAHQKKTPQFVTKITNYCYYCC